MESKRMSNLLFRQQFILGPHYSNDFPSWKKHEITPSVVITAHQDLNINHFTKDDKSLTLLGYLIDPQRPHHNNDEILKRLLSENLVLIDLIRATYELCGNWVLVYKENDRVSLFHDCTGVRSIFYTKVDKTKDLWCASQPRLIADLLDLKEEKNAVDFIIAQKSYLQDHWWPGDTSPYSEIRRLLPNNCFDLRKGEIFRYWPDCNLIKLPQRDAIEKLSKRLKGIMLAATKRFDLAIALSAGWDSRVMLAACKDFKEKVCIYNGKRPEMSIKHPDILIPRRLTSKLNLDYHFIPQSNDIDDDFYKTCEMNAPFPTMEIVPGLQAEFKYFKQQKVAATGNLLEIGRCYYYYKSGNPAEHKPSGELLASHAKMANAQFAIDAFDGWLRSVNDVFNLNIYDIYGWEQRHGSWFANNCLIMYTSWKDIFFPFNCRNLLIDLLSVPDVHRMRPDYTFYRDLVRYMWPDVLSEPINPIQKKGFLLRSKKRLKKIITLR